MRQGYENNPKDREVLERKRSLNGLSTKDNLTTVKPKKFHIFSPGEHLNMFNGEEPSVSYLQLPVKRKEENRFCTRCGEMGHGKRYCQTATWCKFCITDTHAMQACCKYEKFVKDNPIASSRRNTPVQVQGQRVTANTQKPTQQPLFPHPPTQRFNPTVIPHMATNNLAPRVEERESREHSQNSPQNQIQEVCTPMSKQLPHQRSCQDVRMDPRYQKPPQYAEINYHRPSPQMPIEVNEIGPTIQQGVIQRPVQRDTQTAGAGRSTPPLNTQQTVGAPNLQITGNGGARERDRMPKQEGDPDQDGYVLNCIHESRQLTLNDVGRPVFVNHYYAGEAFIPVTSKKLIKLDECDVSTENSLRNPQLQGIERKYREHSQNSWIMQQQNGIDREQTQ